MIDPTEKDIGRKVFHIDGSGQREEGVIVRFSNPRILHGKAIVDWVYVMYGHAIKATGRWDLDWCEQAEPEAGNVS